MCKVLVLHYNILHAFEISMINNISFFIFFHADIVSLIFFTLILREYVSLMSLSFAFTIPLYRWILSFQSKQLCAYVTLFPITSLFWIGVAKAYTFGNCNSSLLPFWGLFIYFTFHYNFHIILISWLIVIYLKL